MSVESGEQVMAAEIIFAAVVALPVTAYISPTFARHIAAWLDAHAFGIEERRRRYRQYKAEIRRPQES